MNIMKKQIRYLVMDVDGTLTNGTIYMGPDGEVFKAFSIKDGYGIHNILPQYGILPIIITGRESKITETRCKELGIVDLYQGVANKADKLDEILYEKGAKFEEVAYIGDDLNDLPVMLLLKQNGGIVACPNNAVNEVRRIAHYIGKQDGGDGAVREFIEYLVSQ